MHPRLMHGSRRPRKHLKCALSGASKVRQRRVLRRKRTSRTTSQKHQSQNQKQRYRIQNSAHQTQYNEPSDHPAGSAHKNECRPGEYPPQSAALPTQTTQNPPCPNRKDSDNQSAGQHSQTHHSGPYRHSGHRRNPPHKSKLTIQRLLTIRQSPGAEALLLTTMLTGTAHIKRIRAGYILPVCIPPPHHARSTVTSQPVTRQPRTKHVRLSPTPDAHHAAHGSQPKSSPSTPHESSSYPHQYPTARENQQQPQRSTQH